VPGVGPIVLASRSPRRREILAAAGIPFIVLAVDVAERQLAGETPGDCARRLAREKAEAAIAGPEAIILGADTIVVVEDQVLGKPADAADAKRMLRLLSGREHDVITGICLRHPGGFVSDAETTRVRFVELSEAEIESYVASGEPLDKAGAYAIQGLASKFIDRVRGCYFNVVGLPVARVYQHLKRVRGQRIPR